MHSVGEFKNESNKQALLPVEELFEKSIASSQIPQIV